MPNPETNKNNAPDASFREKLEASVKSDMAFEYSEDDTLQYVALSTGVKSFVLNSINVSKAIDKELAVDDMRPAGDKAKMTSSQRAEYEAYLASAHSWTYLMPHLLKQVRGVQFDPAILPQMELVTTNLAQALRMGAALEDNRLGIIARSDINAAGRSMEDIASIATFAWLRRTTPAPRPEVSKDPNLLKEHLKSIGILGEQEKAYGKAVEGTDATQKDLRADVDEARALEGAARVTQGFPGAEMLLDRPEVSLNVWKKLLTEGGPREKKAGAAQLGASVRSFKENFLKQNSYEEFAAKIDGLMRGLILENKVENEKSKRVLGFLFGDYGDAVVDRLTTNPEEFEQVKAAILAKVQQAFATIASQENMLKCDALESILLSMEQGLEVNPDSLSTLIDAYLGIQVQNRNLMVGVQRWQVVENALRVGGRGEQTKLEQMTDMAVRRDDGTSGIEWFRRLAPYGSFQTRGYTSPDGRFVLLPADRSTASNELGVHAVEVGKLAAETGGAVLFAKLLKVMGLVKSGAAVSVVAAELQMAATIGAAHEHVIARNGELLNELAKDLDALQKGTDRNGKALSPQLQKQFAQQAADSFFALFLPMLQAANASNNPFVSEREKATPIPKYVLEAHVYTNQLMNAFGLPGYHQLPDRMPLPSPDDESLSPDVRNFLKQRHGPNRDEVHARTHKQLAELRTYEDRLLKVNAPGKPEKSYNTRMLENTGAPAQGLTGFKDLLKSEEFLRGYKEFSKTMTREGATRAACGWMILRMDIATATKPFYRPTAATRVGRWITNNNNPSLEEVVGEDTLNKWRPKLAEIKRSTMANTLNYVHYLEENPPTNREIADYYNNIGIDIRDSEIDYYFGKEATRGTYIASHLLPVLLELNASAIRFEKR